MNVNQDQQERNLTKLSEQQLGEFEAHGLKAFGLRFLNGLIVEEQLNDKEIQDQRRTICFGCDMMDHKNIMCKSCGCFLQLKTASKVNKTKTGSEITHCPLNKWLDNFSKIGYDTSKTKS